MAQIGAREHYAVARAFQGRLVRLYTDAWCGTGLGKLAARGPTPLRAFGNRRADDLARSRVKAFTLAATLRHAVRAARPGDLFADYLSEGAWFGKRVRRELRGMRLSPNDHAFFAYNTGALEPLLAMRDLGVPSVVDQIDPAKTEEDIVAEEVLRWPGWDPHFVRAPTAYWDRLRAEWSAATVVVVNSEWSRGALVAQGLDPARVHVVPLAYEAAGGTVQRTVTSDGPLKVLWLGTVNLRKGIPYLLEAAHQLQRDRIEFTVAGPLAISDRAVKEGPPNVTFLGRVVRGDAEALYASHDVFVLPTLSDGFAITQLEAMARGLPVITTPCCGRVVDHRKDGWLVPPRDPRALAAAILEVHDDRDRLREMSQNASIKATTFTLARVARGLDEALHQPIAT